MKYFSKEVSEIDAIQNKGNTKALLKWLQKHDSSGAYYRLTTSERRNQSGYTLFYINIHKHVESIVPDSAYIMLREEPTRYSKFRWLDEATFNTFYSSTKLT